MNNVIIFFITAFIFSGCDEFPLVKKTKIDRFKIIQISEYRRDQYLIDTADGRLWTKICTEPARDGVACDGISYWKEEKVENLNGVKIQ